MYKRQLYNIYYIINVNVHIGHRYKSVAVRIIFNYQAAINILLQSPPHKLYLTDREGFGSTSPKSAFQSFLSIGNCITFMYNIAFNIMCTVYLYNIIRDILQNFQ